MTHPENDGDDKGKERRRRGERRNDEDDGESTISQIPEGYSAGGVEREMGRRPWKSAVVSKKQACVEVQGCDIADLTACQPAFCIERLVHVCFECASGCVCVCRVCVCVCVATGSIHPCTRRR